MRLPSPARAATTAGILIVFAVLLFAADLAVVRTSGDEARFLPFTVQTDNATVVGMRVLNAGSHDLISAFEMFSSAACGQGQRDVIRIGEDGSWSQSDAWVGGNVTFAILESRDTPDLVRGRSVPTYVEDDRQGPDPEKPPTVEETPIRYGMNGTALPTFTILVCSQFEPLTVQRGERASPSMRFAFNSTEPWLADLPVAQGVDLVYVVRSGEQADNDTYEVLASDLQRGRQFWTYFMGMSTVHDDAGVMPERALRVGTAMTAGLSAVFLALGFRKTPGGPPAWGMDAAIAVAAAGEVHLRRLRRTWGLVGLLLIPLLAAATYTLFQTEVTPPGEDWERTAHAIVLALDVAVLVLWALALLGAQRDLVAWRKAWTRFGAMDLDAL